MTDKLTSTAIRVPVPNGSLAILNLNIKIGTTLTNLNEIIKSAALYGDLVEQIKYEINDELVSLILLAVQHRLFMIVKLH